MDAYNYSAVQPMTIVFGDAIEGLLNDGGKPDLVVLDLPWGATKHPTDKPIDLAALFDALEFVMRGEGTVLAFCQHPYTVQMINAKPDWLRRMLVWDKRRPTGHLDVQYQELRVHTDLLVMSPDGMPYYKPERKPDPNVKERKGYAGNASKVYGKAKGSQFDGSADRWPKSIYSVSVDAMERGVHPFRKPLKLMRQLVRQYCPPGGYVIDPTCGSGATLEACMLEGRPFAGFEIDKPTYEIAVYRLNELYRAICTRKDEEDAAGD